LTSVSVPVTAEEAVKQPCPCCGAPAGKRCHGGSAGWLPQAGRAGQALGERRAFVDVCPGRLEVQRTLL
jgi:hypothetical protein